MEARAESAQAEAEHFDCCRQEAAQGHAGAQYNLGMCYRHGEGVARDMVEAVRY
jgi:TPR repeat protein